MPLSQGNCAASEPTTSHSSADCSLTVMAVGRSAEESIVTNSRVPESATCAASSSAV